MLSRFCTKRAFIGISLSTLVLLTGCAATVSQEEINSTKIADLPSDYREKIKTYLDSRLIDPKSAEYTYDARAPKKGVLFLDRRQTVLWDVTAEVNSKNTRGGYTGRKMYFFHFHNGKIVHFSPISERADAARASLQYNGTGINSNPKRFESEIARIRDNSQLTDLSHINY